jgi:hypothetical protein
MGHGALEIVPCPIPNVSGVPACPLPAIHFSVTLPLSSSFLALLASWRFTQKLSIHRKLYYFPPANRENLGLFQPPSLKRPQVSGSDQSLKPLLDYRKQLVLPVGV